MSPEEMLEAMNRMITAAVAPINQRLDTMQGTIDTMQKDIKEIKENAQRQEQFERGTRVLIENEVMSAVRVVAEQHGTLVKKIDALSQRRESNIALRQHVKTMDDVILNHTNRIEQLEAKAQ